MSTVIISSTQDNASTNIKNALLTNSEWEERGIFLDQSFFKSTTFSDVYLMTITDKIILHENLEHEIKQLTDIIPTRAIFISRHRSKTGKPTLTTHPIGNYGKAKFGGKDHTLTPALPHHMTTLLRIIHENRQRHELYHQICFEVTHHGPFMSIPTFFTEVGSNEEEWKKQKPAAIIATSLIQLLNRFKDIEKASKNIPVLLGIGGGHYAPRFTDVALEKQVSFSHMIPNYHIKDGAIDKNQFHQIIDQIQPIDGVYLHRKSLKKSQQTQFKEWCKALNLPVVSSKNLNDIS